MCGIKQEWGVGQVESVWRRVTGQFAYSVRASASGCRWGTYGVGQEPLGPWWCKTEERMKLKAWRRVGRNTSPATRVVNALTPSHINSIAFLFV